MMGWEILGAGALGLIGSLIGAEGAEDASNAQVAAGNNSIAAQLAMFEQVRKALEPYSKNGEGALAALNNALAPGGLLSEKLPTWDPTDLASTPGYQFSLDQGLKSVQNAYAAKGLGNSGAALRGAADYAQGLAEKTYEQRFQDWLNTTKLGMANKELLYNMLMGPAQLGQNAAAGFASSVPPISSGIGNTIAGIGQAQAAGAVGQANAWASGVNNLVNNALLWGIYK